MRSSAQIWTARRCSAARSTVSARATARPSRIRWCALRTSRGTSCSSSRWDWTPRRSMCRAFRPPCRLTCSFKCCTRSRDSSTPRSCARLTRSSTTASIRSSCAPRLRPKKSRACTARASSAARPAMRKPRRRDWSRASTRRLPSRARSRSSSTARTAISAR